MANIFTLDKFSDDFSEKINIDDLYEKKHMDDLQKLEIYKKMLNRIHVRIKAVSNQHEKCCWYIVPEIILGVPKYDQAACIAYVISALQDNGFLVRYFHPNAVFITWNHWVPSYMRNEIKKKTGIVVNQFGETVHEKTDDDGDEANDAPIEQRPISGVAPIANSKKYTPITSYKPSGKLVYDNDLMNRIDHKIK